MTGAAARATCPAAAALLLALGVGACGSSSSPDSGAPSRHRTKTTRQAVDRLSLREQVGQLLILSFHGDREPGYVDDILRDRTAAGVILFGENAASPGQLRALTGSLQRAGGGSVVVSTDQEGGAVRILRFAAPDTGQRDQATRAQARDAARSAARDLRRLGINVNLAPVADVPGAGRSAVAGRAFPGDARSVAGLVTAAVRGAAAGGGAATAKHFPGLGAAPANTDAEPVSIDRPAATLRAQDLPPFRAAVAAGVPLVMVSHALYPALDPSRIASQSRILLRRVLRDELGFSGAVVTDSMEARAVIRRSPVDQAAVRSVAAGVDLVLMTGPGSYRLVFPRLLREARRSAQFRARVRDAAARVLALKARLGLRPPR
jgi:beta-N-acetylhexosaminidase